MSKITSITYDPYEDVSLGEVKVFLNRNIFHKFGYVRIIVFFSEANSNYKTTLRVWRHGDQSNTSEVLNELDSNGQPFELDSNGQPFSCFLLYLGAFQSLESMNREETLILEISVNGKVIEETELFVLDNDGYSEYLDELCGATWDQPIYWDEATPEQIQSLLFSPPFGNLLSSVPLQTVVDAETLIDFLGVTIAGSFASGPTPPPFKLDLTCVCDQPFMLPHIDLVRLLWLLTMMGFIWADVFFFCKSLSINIKVNHENANLEMHLSHKLFIKDNIEDWLKFDSVNRWIYRGVKDWIAQSVIYDFRWDEMLFEISMNSESTPSPRGISAGA